MEPEGLCMEIYCSKSLEVFICYWRRRPTSFAYNPQQLLPTLVRYIHLGGKAGCYRRLGREVCLRTYGNVVDP